MSTIALISCAKSKRDAAAPAVHLYTSPLFRWSVAYAERKGVDRLYVLSAKHGLVEHREVIAPYAQTLVGLDRDERRRWGDRVLAELARRHDLVRDQFLILAGEPYVAHLRDAPRRRREPLRGLGLDARLRFLGRASRTEVELACDTLHRLLRGHRRWHADFDPKSLPERGIYFIFEKGERGHGGDRIVRIGTHTGRTSTLGDRLEEHYATANKDRSIFRKNLGRALLAERGDPYLRIWDLDMIAGGTRRSSGRLVSTRKQSRIESLVTRHLAEQTSFVVLECEAGGRGLRDLEAGLIATVAQCRHCWASDGWLGNVHPDPRIRASSLWQVQHLAAAPLTEAAVRRALTGRPRG